MEEYRTIEKYPTYEVSNMGNVRNIETKKMRNIYIKDGYYTVSLNSKTLGIHRLVAITFLENPLNKPKVDHINNIRSDNRVENLRFATNAENGANSLMSCKNTSGYKGVRFNELSNKWYVAFNYKPGVRSKYYEEFDELEDAIVARVEKMIEFYGDFVNYTEINLYNEILKKRNNTT